MRDRIANIFFIVLFVVSCQQQQHQQRAIERSFYFWKSVFKPTETEKKLLEQLQVKTLYLKFFDVDWNNSDNIPIPVAQVRIIDSVYLKNFTVIPVVFITNSCIQKITTPAIKSLAHNIALLVKNICTLNPISFAELQIDCDWTQSTRDNYFALLRAVRTELDSTVLSCTIRLHQLKYLAESGVPPVDRGLLMVYNMGNLKDPGSKNSILDVSEMKKYISSLDIYPLRLDVAFPLFEWKVLFRNNFFTGLLENFDDSLLALSSKKISTARFEVLKDIVVDGYQLKKDDIIRKEESSYQDILSASKTISEKLPGTKVRVALFHLDSIILKKYTANEMENIFNSLH